MTPHQITRPKIITVASGKGGVGKTWLSATLSHCFARRGRDVLLFDGDLGLANIDIQLGLMPEKDLSEYLNGSQQLDTIISRYQDPAHVGFDVISGQSGSGSLANMSPETLKKLGQDLHSLSDQYDTVLMDLGAGVDQSVTTMASFADQIVVVATPDPTSLTDAYAFIKVNRLRHENVRISVVVNMARDRHEGKRTYDALKKACENFLQFTPAYLGYIRRDDHVVDAIRQQSPLFNRFPQSQAGEDILQIVKKL